MPTGTTPPISSTLLKVIKPSAFDETAILSTSALVSSIVNPLYTVRLLNSASKVVVKEFSSIETSSGDHSVFLQINLSAILLSVPASAPNPLNCIVNILPANIWFPLSFKSNVKEESTSNDFNSRLF